MTLWEYVVRGIEGIGFVCLLVMAMTAFDEGFVILGILLLVGALVVSGLLLQGLGMLA